MPRYCDSHTAYGCGHPKEHSEAAKKGWRTRRGLGPVAALRRAEGVLSDLYGEDVTQAHTHSSHPNEVRYKMGGQWYRTSKDEFHAMVREGEQVRRENQRAAAREAREAEREHASAPVRAMREKIREKQYRDAMERIAEDEQTRIYAAALRTLRKRGISPDNRHTKYFFHRRRELPVDYGEWESLPKSLRRRKGGYTFDGAIEVLAEEGVISHAQLDSFDHGDFHTLVEKMQLWKRDMKANRADRKKDIAHYQGELQALRARRAKSGGKSKSSEGQAA